MESRRILVDLLSSEANEIKSAVPKALKKLQTFKEVSVISTRDREFVLEEDNEDLEERLEICIGETAKLKQQLDEVKEDEEKLVEDFISKCMDFVSVDKGPGVTDQLPLAPVIVNENKNISQLKSTTLVTSLDFEMAPQGLTQRIEWEKVVCFLRLIRSIILSFFFSKFVGYWKLRTQ